MKDAQGHGSNARGSSGELDRAVTNFQAAHQAGVNQAAPSQTGQELYQAAMAAALYDHPNPYGYDANTRRQIEPDFDEMPAGSNPYYPRSN